MCLFDKLMNDACVLHMFVLILDKYKACLYVYLFEIKHVCICALV